MLNPAINIFRKAGTLVRYNHLLARSHPAGPNYIVLNFESDEIPPEVLSDVQLEQAYGRELNLVHDRKTLPNHALTLTPKQKNKLFKIEAYLDTLYEMGGQKDIIGGIKLREKVIKIASKRLNDESPPSPAQLAIWAQEQRDYVGGVSAKISTAVKNKRLSKFEEIQAFAIEVADEFIFGKFTSFQYFYDIFVTRAEKIFKVLPSRETLRKWLEQIICPKIRLKGIGSWLAQTNQTNKVTCYYSDCDLSAITVLCPRTLHEFKVPAIDKNIKLGMSLIEFQALSPSAYKKKGFSHYRTMEDNPEIIQGHDAVNKKVDKKKTTKLRRASIEDMQNNIDTLAIENYKPTDIDPYDDELDWDDIEPLPQS